jgi:sucrose phosphorylase
MRGSFEGEDQFQIQRFVCAHAIMLALEGVPAFYIHSLVGTENDHNKVAMSSNKRAINRHVWELDELKEKLADGNSINHQVFNVLKKIIAIRKKQKAFHPNATQFTLHFEESVFAFWRQSMDRAQSIFCIYNVSNRSRYVRLQDINLIELDQWQDLISGKVFQDQRERVKLKPYEFLWISNKHV